jgi:hypothetical protein
VTRTTLLRAAAFMALGGLVAPSCSEGIDDLSPDHPPIPANFSPAPSGLRRLLGRQYINSVRVLLGGAGAQAATPPPDGSLHGFDSIAAAELSLPPTAVATYEASARAIGHAAVADPATLAAILPCTPTGPADAACHRQFVTSFGRLAWRRALDAPEVDRIAAIAQRASSEYSDFKAGVAYAISALLQSPNFLYMVELGERAQDLPEEMHRLTKGELLTRMSFFLLDQTPGAELLDFVDQHDLDAETIRQLAHQLVERPEAHGALAAFYSEILRVRDLEDLSKSEELFPQFSPALAQAMKEETLRLVDDIVWERDTDVRELLTADYTFVNQDLTALYGIAPPAADGFKKVTLPDGQTRSGILSTSAFLSRFAHPDQTSPTRRGLFVRTTVLCEDISPAPPGVNTTLPGPSSQQTLKQQLEAHMREDQCKGCHALMDPIGFALESYDAIGAFRTHDNGLPIDTTATDVVGIGSFASARELGALLREDPRVSLCVIKNLLRSSLGHMETPGEKPAIGELDDVFAAGGYRMRALLVELCASPVFQLVGDPK